jgi:hypothetical protein
MVRFLCLKKFAKIKLFTFLFRLNLRTNKNMEEFSNEKSNDYYFGSGSGSGAGPLRKELQEGRPCRRHHRS